MAEGHVPTVRPLLGVPETRRLCLDLIAAEQDRAVHEGRLDRARHIATLAVGLSEAAIDQIELGEEGLGFDSLSLIDLVGVLTRYFGLAASGVEDYLLVRTRIGDWAQTIGHHFEVVGAEAKLTFTTSGTSGEPSVVSHCGSTLESEARAILAEVFGQGSMPKRVLCGVSPRHLYGFLWGCLAPSIAGIPVVDVHWAAPTRVFREARPGDVVLGTPHTWDLLSRTLSRPLAGVVGVTSGAPAKDATWALRDNLGISRLIEAYGSTETGGVGFRDRHDCAFALFETLSRKGDGIERTCAPGHPLELQDRLRWVSEREFFVDGRLDDVIQVAGTNVSLTHVRQTIRESPDVAEAAVRPNSARLKAFVVPKDHLDDHQDLESRLRRHLEKTLPPPARPDRIDFGSELPRSAMGKLTDW